MGTQRLNRALRCGRRSRTAAATCSRIFPAPLRGGWGGGCGWGWWRRGRWRSSGSGENIVGGDGEVAGGVPGPDAVVVESAGGEAGKSCRVSGNKRGLERSREAIGSGGSVVYLGV